ncbi:MAG: hypothetical protein QMD12_00825, partial [Candidatus Aenigmarchaeota archaeon]|nr:hypothetical protein [Candidatus Aenigmarchaeota archaeon]
SGQYVTAVGSSLSCSTPPGGVGGSGSDNYIPRWSGSSSLENSVIYQTDGGNVGIGTTDPGNYKLKVAGDGSITGNLAVGGGIGAGGLAPATGYGIVAQGSTGGGYFYDKDGTSRAYLAYGDYAIWSEGGAGIVARGSQWGGWFYDTDGTSRVFLARGSYGIYQDTGSTNYFAGSIGIGTADPGNWRLNVQSSGTDHPRGLSSIAGGGTTTVGIAGRGRDASTSNYGVYAYAGGPDGSTNYGVYARATCTSGTCTKWGLYVVEGNAYFAGNIYKTGTVNFVQDLNETHKLVYTSSESGEIEVEWTDSIFVDKEVFVPFPDHYRYVLSKKEDYHVLATPVNSLARVGVFNKTTEGFTLKSSEPTQVDFHVRGIRSGYEDHPIIITR